MSGSFEFHFVYKRRKVQGNCVSKIPAPIPACTRRSGEDCVSAISFDIPAAAVKEPEAPHLVSRSQNEIEPVQSPILLPILFDGLSSAVDLASNEAFKSNKHKIIEVDSINDSCSSSKSTIELVSNSLRNEGDDSGECSSSSIVVVEGMGEDFPEKDQCISILRSQGVLNGVSSSRDGESVFDSSGRIGSCSCKNCGRTESTLKMLICDNCEASFHLSCCSPSVKRIPADEWFCKSCLKKKRLKFLKESIFKEAPHLIDRVERLTRVSPETEVSPIALMLRDDEPYISGVRVGKGFQAEVLDWSGPINDADSFGEPLEMDSSDFLSLHRSKSNNPSKIDSVGNWLQCREVVYDADGVNQTICGKWRRAPIFEVQTDDWECFCSFLWDPAHADCAVPQELETDQILKQLNYVRMLKPQLAAQRRKWGHTKNGGSSGDKGDRYQGHKI